MEEILWSYLLDSSIFVKKFVNMDVFNLHLRKSKTDEDVNLL